MSATRLIILSVYQEASSRLVRIPQKNTSNGIDKMNQRTRRPSAAIHSVSIASEWGSPRVRLRVSSLEDKELWWSTTRKDVLQNRETEFTGYLTYLFSQLSVIIWCSLTWVTATLLWSIKDIWKKSVLPAYWTSLTQSHKISGISKKAQCIKVLTVQAWWWVLSLQRT